MGPPGKKGASTAFPWGGIPAGARTAFLADRRRSAPGPGAREGGPGHAPAPFGIICRRVTIAGPQSLRGRIGTGRRTTSTPVMARITALLFTLAALVLAALPAQARVLLAPGGRPPGPCFPGAIFPGPTF